MAGLLVGTLEYMAPEQVAGDDVDPAWDVWAVNIIAYEMLTGRHPFRQAVRFGDGRHADDGATAEHGDGVALPPSIEAFLRRALSRDRSDRPTNAEDFLAGIERVLQCQACVMPSDEPFFCKTPDEYLFWDGIHPTRAAHTIVAQAAATVLGL